MRTILAPLSLAALLLLTGCSGTDAPSAEAPSVDSAKPSASPTAEPSASTTAASAAEKSERGNLVKQVGQGAGVSTLEGEQTVTFVINAITVDGQCTGEFATPPENGHFVILDVSVKTEPALAETDIPQFYMSAADWKAIAPNGTTSNANPGTVASFSCLPDQEKLPQTMGPAEQATGKVVLDLENPEGTLIFQDVSAMSGWEWTYPAP